MGGAVMHWFDLQPTEKGKKLIMRHGGSVDFSVIACYQVFDAVTGVSYDDAEHNKATVEMTWKHGDWTAFEPTAGVCQDTQAHTLHIPFRRYDDGWRIDRTGGL